MGQTIISAIGVYISTSIDYLIVLIILFAQLSQNKQKWHIYAGQYLGTGLLVGVSLVAAYVVNFVPEAWMVGLLGLIPIYLGIRFAIVGEGEEEEEEEEEEIIERLEQSKANQLFWTVTLLTIASGGDNLSIYIPYFASLDWAQTLVALLVFAIGVIIFCEPTEAVCCHALRGTSSHSLLYNNFFEQFGREAALRQYPPTYKIFFYKPL